MTTMEMCHIYLLELDGNMATIFKGDAIPASVLEKYGIDAIKDASRHHFTATIPGDTEFPGTEITRDDAQAWFDDKTDNVGVNFYRQND